MTADRIPTFPDSISAIAAELAETKGHVIRIDVALGQPAMAGQFEGDPPRAATGLCATIDRLAKAEAARTKRSMWTAGGVATIIAGIVEAVNQIRQPAPPPPPMPHPTVQVAPSAHACMVSLQERLAAK